MDYFKTQYEKLYESDEYYWGKDPADFLDELAKIKKPEKDVKVLDIGCGEGKDIVYMAKLGYDCYAFDITTSGINKTLRLAKENGVSVNAYIDDINTFTSDIKFDIIYSTGTIQYLNDDEKDNFFKKVDEMTNVGGIHFFNVFVNKPYLELPPDWDVNEKMWKTGELFTHYENYKIHKIDEITFLDNSSNVPHYHCMDNIIAEKMK